MHHHSLQGKGEIEGPQKGNEKGEMYGEGKIEQTGGWEWGLGERMRPEQSWAVGTERKGHAESGGRGNRAVA